MASKNNSQGHQAGDKSGDKIDTILEILLELHKLLCSLKEDPLKAGISERENQNGPLARSQSAPPPTTHIEFDGKLFEKLQYLFQVLKLNLGNLEQFQTNVRVQLDKHLKHLVTLKSMITDLEIYRGSSQQKYLINPELEGIEKKISVFLYQLSLFSGKQKNHKLTAYGDQDDEDEDHQYKTHLELPGIHVFVNDLTQCEAFKQVKQKFMELEIERKICLLSFAVFPENREVHRTVLMYWWIGEGILSVEGAEEAVKEVLKEFTEKNLVEPVEERRKMAPSSYKMTPFVHSSVIHLSKKIGVFDIYGQGWNPSMHMPEKGKMFIVEESAAQREATAKKMSSMDIETIETVFNVSDIYPDFTIKWFSKKPRTWRRFTISSSEAGFKSLNVFYLGRWERTKKRQIEVENHELMKCFKHVTKVKVLSLQGISNIRSLDSSVCKLHQLTVLDLRECSKLTELPERIDLLRSLVYLDMTGCYMLEWIPLSLALLKNLEVLKGFVVSNDLYKRVACDLSYLKKMENLRKLSIEIDRENVYLGDLIEDLVEIKVTSLKVTWRDIIVFPRMSKASSEGIIVRTATRLGAGAGLVRVPNGFGVQLKKLNLQRYPNGELHSWLYPRNLLHLEKLCIGGGRILEGFGELPKEATNCAVKVLRLTSLPELSVGWIELKQLYFPNLIFLEKYECPRVTLTPCDGNGIWRSDQDSKLRPTIPE